MTQQQLDKRVILVGDINIPHQPIDLGPGLLKLGARGGYSQEEVDWVTHFTTPTTQTPSDQQLPANPADTTKDSDHSSLTPARRPCIDAWRRLHPTARNVFTCWNQRTEARSRNDGLRIDYTFVDSELVSSGKLLTADILDMPNKWSDHTAVAVTLQGLTPPATGRPVLPIAAENWSQFRRPGISLMTFFSKTGAKTGDVKAKSKTKLPSRTSSACSVASSASSASEASSRAAIPRRTASEGLLGSRRKGRAGGIASMLAQQGNRVTAPPVSLVVCGMDGGQQGSGTPVDGLAVTRDREALDGAMLNQRDEGSGTVKRQKQRSQQVENSNARPTPTAKGIARYFQ